jgi:hypothetical protein
VACQDKLEPRIWNVAKPATEGRTNMNHLKRNFSPIVVGMLLMVMLVGLTGAGTNVGAAVSKQVVIPAAYFYPDAHTVGYKNHGFVLYSFDPIAGIFWAPVNFVVPGAATVEKLELFGYDESDIHQIRVWLYKTKPDTGWVKEMANIETGEEFTSTISPRTWTDSTIDGATVKPPEAAYVKVWFGPGALSFYGVKVWYHKGY